MFFEALLKLALVLILGTFLVTFIWLSIYRFFGFLMPDWLTGWFAQGIIWVRHQKPSNLAVIDIIFSTGIDVIIWRDLWIWTILIGGVGSLCVWFFTRE